MDSAAIGTIANITTTIIVAVTAFAALRQMRHNHVANELQVHLQFINEITQPDMVGAINWTFEFAERMRDPLFREAASQELPSEDAERMRKAVRFFERYASLVIVSGLSERLIFYEYAGLIAQVWDNVYLEVARRRRFRNPYGARAFEHLAMRANAYAAKKLPADFARLERDPRLVAREAAEDVSVRESPPAKTS